MATRKDRSCFEPTKIIVIMNTLENYRTILVNWYIERSHWMARADIPRSLVGSHTNWLNNKNVFVVVNFDALAQASDIRIERRQVDFLCWRQDSNPSGSQTPNRQQTECPLTNRLSYRGSSKTWTRQPVPMISEHSAHSTPQPFGIRTWLWRYTCLLLLISMLWHWQAIFESKGDKLSSSAEGRIRTHQGLRYQIASRLNARWDNSR